MTAAPLIVVRLTREQWAALHGCAVGELESLTAEDEKSGVHEHLRDAVAAMVAARSQR
jgi:hypothetical protein